MALRYHPDKNPDNPSAVEQFRRVTAAYNHLIKNFKAWAPVSAKPPKGPVKQVTVEDLEDIFDDIFGFTREDRILGLQNPQDLKLNLIDFAFGVRKLARLEVYDKCRQCRGSGAQKNTPSTICTYCFGSGQIKLGSDQEPTFKICPRCGGRGRKVTHACPACNGFGRMQSFRKQEVEIPPGLHPDQAYTLHAKDARSTKKSDLFIRPRLTPHPLFKVEKSDILCEYPLARKRAEKGGVIDFPTLWGWTRLTIPPQSRSGQVIKMKGWGLYTNPSKKRRGDLHVRLKLFPEKTAAKNSTLFLKKVALNNQAYGNSKGSWWKKLFG